MNLFDRFISKCLHSDKEREEEREEERESSAFFRSAFKTKERRTFFVH